MALKNSIFKNVLILINCQARIHGKIYFLYCNNFYSFNQLDLPDYESKEILKERLLIAIREGKEFGFM